MKFLWLPLALVVVVVSADKPRECKQKCANCPVIDRLECVAGTNKDDECGCCDVCSRIEGQSCDKPKERFRHGQCGYGLECRRVTGGKDLCQCSWDEIICGTDNKTYNNLCQLMAAGVRQSKQETLKVKSVGPCDPGSTIMTKPEYVRNITGSNIVLTCEAIGFPTPSIYWEMKRVNSKSVMMPGDDNHVVSAMRGGPGKYQVTAWLQIEDLHKRHEGDYTCVAVNEHKDDRARARVKVVN